MSIHAKIQKLLSLGERAGTEAEAQNAMALAHALLAKHNLSLSEVQSYDAEPQEAIITDDSIPSQLRNTQWRDIIYSFVGKLYFCTVYTQKSRSLNTRCYCIVGRPSNVAIVKYMAEYLIRTCDELALEGARDETARRLETSYVDADEIRSSSRAWAASFRAGFSYRISARVLEQIEAARAGKMKDETGTALVLAPLYDKEKREIDEHMMKSGCNPRQRAASLNVRSKGGFDAGLAAGDAARLEGDAVGQQEQKALTA